MKDAEARGFKDGDYNARWRSLRLDGKQNAKRPLSYGDAVSVFSDDPVLLANGDISVFMVVDKVKRLEIQGRNCRMI